MRWIAPISKDNVTATTTQEKRLWASNDALRANSVLTAAQYSQPLLDFVFLRISEAKFAARRAEQEKSATGRRVSRADDAGSYHAVGVLFLPPQPASAPCSCTPRAARTRGASARPWTRPCTPSGERTLSSSACGSGDIHAQSIPESPGANTGFYLLLVPKSSRRPHAVFVDRKNLRYPVRDGARTRFLSESEVADLYRSRFRDAENQVKRLEKVEADGLARAGQMGEASISLAIAPEIPGNVRITKTLLHQIQPEAPHHGYQFHSNIGVDLLRRDHGRNLITKRLDGWNIDSRHMAHLESMKDIRQLLCFCRTLLAEIMQGFGVPEVQLITKDGDLHETSIQSNHQAIKAWAENSGIKIATSVT